MDTIPVFLLVYTCLWAILLFVTIASFLVMVLWKQCLRHGIACSYDKNANLVAHFIGSIYHVCIWIF